MKPAINLNGTSVGDLIAQHYAVVLAARKLKEALAAAAPHGRDYQTLEQGALGEARDEWMSIVKGARDAEYWADVRLNDLMRQNVERNGDKAYGIAQKAMETATLKSQQKAS